MAVPDDNAYLAFLNLPHGDEAVCSAAFIDNGSASSILGGRTSLLPNLMCQQVLNSSNRNDVAKMAQMAIFPLPYGELGNLLPYQDIQKLTQINASTGWVGQALAALWGRRASAWSGTSTHTKLRASSRQVRIVRIDQRAAGPRLTHWVIMG